MGKNKAGVLNINELARELTGVQKSSKEVLELTVKDFKAKAPGWVGTAVTERYQIPKKEITPASGGYKIKVGGFSLSGKTIDTASIVYKGRRLTPTHFGLTPRVPKPNRTYTLGITVHKGEKRTLGKNKRLGKKQRANIGRNFKKQGNKNSPKSPIMIQNIRGNNLPVQRMSQNRNNLRVIRTTSIGHMVNNVQVRQTFNNKIDTDLMKRFNHHLNRKLPVRPK